MTTHDLAAPAAADPPDRAAGEEPALTAELAATSGLQQLVRIVGAVGAPTSLLTALAYYFGWSYAYFYFDYLGVHATVLDQGTADYLLNSVDALFVPIAVGAFVVLLALWAHAPLHARLTGFGARARSIPLLAVTIAGVVLTLAGLWSVITPTPLRDYIAAGPLCLAIGVLLLAYTVHLWRTIAVRRGATAWGGSPAWSTVAEWTITFAIVSICLFWAAQAYAPAVGRSRAHQLVASLPYLPPVTLYSEHSLYLNAPGVRETRCGGAEAGYHYRYDGLRLILKSGTQYLFLPAHWSRGQGVAILIPRTDSVRLEFRPAGAQSASPPPTC